MSHGFVRMLISLYPRRWRRRYGAELEQLVVEMDANRDRSRMSLAAGLVASAGVERLRWLGTTGTAAIVGVVALAMMIVTLATSSSAHAHPRGGPTPPAAHAAHPRGASPARCPRRRPEHELPRGC